MSYLVLARKWRPRSFAELAGQEHVVRALSNALDSGRVHHAILFTGTRGVGKTTIARILAKALNCETGVSARPCGVCGACREIDEGRFIDLIEVDAASSTKVEDTRELLENVQYAPARGRYKVYLIDEVHMLSGHSFNALLKTLEEPPPHVKFLLATTDPQKLPMTVVSRCLQFHLKRLPPSLIGERLGAILAAEAVEFEAGALPVLARAADGSVRDALSLLDQALVFGGGKILESDVRSMLGTIDRGHVVRLLEGLAEGDAPGLIETLRALDEQSPDYDQVLVELAALIERLALTQLVPDSGADGGFDPVLLAGLAPRFAAADLQLYYQIALLGRRDLDLAPEPRVGFEMTVLRMLAFRPAGTGARDEGEAAARPAPAPSARGATPLPAGSLPTTTGTAPTEWQALLARLDVSGAARQLAANCVWIGRDGDVVRLRLDRRSESLRTSATEERLAQALSRQFGAAVRLVIERDEASQPAEIVDTPARREARATEAQLAQARATLEADPTVRALREKFSATVQAESVKPNR
jgi:DNA polymerase III subunit gamma/tau